MMGFCAALPRIERRDIRVSAYSIQPHRRPVVLHTRVVRGTGGGPDKTILNSPRFLRPLGYDAICAYMHPPRDAGFCELITRAAAWKAPIVSIPDSGPFDLKVVSRLLGLCRAERVSIWHGHDYKSNALGLLLRRFWPMRLVTTVHGWGVKHTRRTPIYYAVDRLCLQRYDRVICVSADLFAQCRSLGIDAAKCILVENAIDTQQFQRHGDIQSAKRRLGFDGRTLIGAVGRLSEEKGFDRLIRSTDRLLRDGLRIGLVIIGEGPDRPRLTSVIRSLGRQEDIQLLGFRSNIAEYFQAMDVFALSSLREGLPNVVLEAMALGVPVVASRVAGTPQVVDDGTNGLLVDPGDEQQLAQSLRRLLEDATLRQRLGQAGRQTVVERFSFERRMQKIREIYDSVLAERTATP